MMLIACFIASGWRLVRAVRDANTADAAVCTALLVLVMAVWGVAN